MGDAPSRLERALHVRGCSVSLHVSALKGGLGCPLRSRGCRSLQRWSIVLALAFLELRVGLDWHPVRWLSGSDRFWTDRFCNFV